MNPLPASLNIERAQLAERYLAVRRRSLELAAPLSEADCQVQSMPDASPTKWHLAHVTWFFETFILEANEPGFRPFEPAFRVLFNSYYNAVGDKHPRIRRGEISRPAMAEVRAYRAQVDERMLRLITGAAPGDWLWQVELGLQHEQQHQELLLTDILHALSRNPLLPAYSPAEPRMAALPPALDWHRCESGLAEIGHDGAGFAFDNEAPRHKVWLAPHALANRPVTNGEWAEFIADGGYREARWWLSAGWDWVTGKHIEAPLYWQRSGPEGVAWHAFTLHGLLPLDRHAPATHISYFEADAFARWQGATSAAQRGARLPTEAEWEHCAAGCAATQVPRGNFADSRVFSPMAMAAMPGQPVQLFGDVWEWTSSAYSAYPGYRPWSGAVGEYNGKFMVNQYVLRGGSCATPRSHIRATYRNFFPTEARWQFTGLRLARDLE
jgi:ergothioneine biosynthesis protein EgtB